MQVVENVALISINATLVAQLISFLIFMVLFNRILIRPIRKVMAERDQYLGDMRERIVEIDRSYGDISVRIKNQESETRRAASKIREEIEAEGQRSKGDLMAQTKQEIDQLRSAAQKETDAQIAKARESVAAEAEGLADQMIAAMLERRSQR